MPQLLSWWRARFVHRSSTVHPAAHRKNDLANKSALHQLMSDQQVGKFKRTEPDHAPTGLGDATSAGASTAQRPVRSPTGIELNGWREILLRTFKAFNADQIPAWAAGVTFFVLLGLFPALSAFVSLYGLFADTEEARSQIQGLAGLLPAGAVSLLTDQLERLAATKHASLGLTFLLSLLVSLWSSNAGVKSLFTALNAAYEVKEHRRFLQFNVTSLSFTVGLVIFSMLAVSVVVAAPETLSFLGLGHLAVIAVLRWPMILIITGVVLGLLYRYGPCRPIAKWRWISPGSVVASAGWLLMSLAFSWYVTNFGHYDVTYGALGGLVGFMTWIWLSLIVALFGAELNREIERQAVDQGSPTGGTHP